MDTDRPTRGDIVFGMAGAVEAHQRRHGSVTERLSARLDEIDPVVGRMLKNEAKLIADSVAMEARMQSLSRQQGVTFNSLSEFCGRSFWQRLRWLFRGV